jgi:hypothetical protein
MLQGTSERHSDSKGPQTSAQQQQQYVIHSGGGLFNEREVVRKAGKDRINEFLRSHTCYDLLKHSGKVCATASRCGSRHTNIVEANFIICVNIM